MHVIFMPFMIDIKQTNKKKVIVFLFVEKQILHFTIILHFLNITLKYIFLHIIYINKCPLYHCLT